MTEMNYKEAYEKEREKCIKLEDRLATDRKSVV